MDWKQRGAIFESAEGYRIAAIRDARGLMYSAFAPEIPYEVFKTMLRIQYAIGQHVPQQRPLLGCFADPAVAREVCERHLSGICPHPPTGQEGAVTDQRNNKQHPGNGSSPRSTIAGNSDPVETLGYGL